MDSRGIITTVAGTGRSRGPSADGTPRGAYGGDGGPAIKADLDLPNGMTFDSDGNLWFADSGANRIRKIDARGVITTVAGSGRTGFSGDGGPALNAAFQFPFDIKFNPAGELFIADCYNNRIRKIDRRGVITTVVGSGKWGFSGDGGPALKATLRFPDGIAFDRQNRLLVCDEANHRIRRVDSHGVISTVAGSGPADPKAGAWAGDGGPATSARLNYPSGVVADAQGDLFISDLANHRVRKVNPRGVISTLAGNGGERLWRLFHGYGDNGPPLHASLAYPRGLALMSSGDLLVADGGNDRVRLLTHAAPPQPAPPPAHDAHSRPLPEPLH